MAPPLYASVVMQIFSPRRVLTPLIDDISLFFLLLLVFLVYLSVQKRRRDLPLRHLPATVRTITCYRSPVPEEIFHDSDVSSCGNPLPDAQPFPNPIPPPFY